jgi:hypothetical protein
LRQFRTDPEAMGLALDKSAVHYLKALAELKSAGDQALHHQGTGSSSKIF